MERCLARIAAIRQGHPLDPATMLGPQVSTSQMQNGGYKMSGVGRENHKMMLDHYSQTKCLLVSYDPEPLGFF